MDRTRLQALGVGLVTVLLMCFVGFCLKRSWLSAEMGVPILGFLGIVLMSVRSWMLEPFPRQPRTPAIDAAQTALNVAVAKEEVPKSTPGTGAPLVFLLIGLGCALAPPMLVAALSCSPAANRTAEKEAQVAAEVTGYEYEVGKCRTDARATFDVCAASAGAAKLDCKVHALAQFDSCACTVDAKYKHDAGVCQ